MLIDGRAWALAQSDLDTDLLSNALSTGLIGGHIFYHDLVGSTMDEARKAAEANSPDGTVIVAEEQTEGRGRFNRSWVSPRGQNLLFSVLLYPEPHLYNQMNMAASLAVTKAVSSLSGLHPTIKWPNDVRLQGKKMAGILIESSVGSNGIGYAVIGIGVNVNFDPSLTPEIASIATSMYSETGRTFSRQEVLRSVLEEMETLYVRVKAGWKIASDWSALVESLGKQVQVRWDDQVYEGLAQEVDDEGNLLLMRQDGSTLKLTAGEVTLQS